MLEKQRQNSRLKIGGQAIIEGVMMRGPQRISAAVRLPNGEIEHKIWNSEAWHKRAKIWSWPVIRGAVSLGESLSIGIRTLNWSAEVAIEYEKKGDKKSSDKGGFWGIGLSLFLAVLVAVIFFMWLPYQIAEFCGAGQNQALFHLIAGSTRIAFFLIYIWAISLMKDIQRIFQYHGAEHQAVYAYEKELELTEERTRVQSCFHPRCGTSFILIVALLTMLVFVVFDVLVVSVWGNYPNALVRVLIHLPFLPLVAGISYEFLKLSDRLREGAFIKALILPGLALQRLTTRKPSADQREVALFALQEALPKSPVGNTLPD